MANIATLDPRKPSAVPPKGRDYETHLKGWLSDAIRESQGFLQNQYGYDKMDDIIRAIMGATYDGKMKSAAVSELTLNHMGKIALDLASSLTDIKPFWTYKTSNDRYERTTQMAQKLSSQWWTNRLIDLKFCDSIKFCLAGGASCPHITYNQETQDLDLIAEDPRDVLPIRPGSTYSIQECFGIAIRRERTVNALRQMYPDKANLIKADRDASYSQLSKQTAAAKMAESMGMSGFMSNLWASLGGRPNLQVTGIPTADVYTVYVKDDSLNMTGKPVLMGEPNRNWSYMVAPGEPLYPRKRCITMTSSAVLRDGPSIYWHGLFPTPKLVLDPWPFSRAAWFGKAPLRDLLTSQIQIDKVARGISDLMEKYWRPDLLTDSKSTAKTKADHIDTRRPGLRLRYDSRLGQSVALQYPEMAGVSIAIEWLKLLVDAQKELAGTQELSALVQLGQLPSSETVERLIESFSPAIRLRSRVMEAFLRELAMMVLMNFFQFYTQAQRVAALGPQGVTFEDADHDPGTLIPDMLNMMAGEDNPLPIAERAKVFLANFTYELAPGSLLAASEVTDKLMYLQLSRMGFVDPITLLEKLGVNNIGAPNEVGKTIVERMAWAQSVGWQMAVGPAGASAAGRKASGQAMPRMTVKES